MMLQTRWAQNKTSHDRVSSLCAARFVFLFNKETSNTDKTADRIKAAYRYRWNKHQQHFHGECMFCVKSCFRNIDT